MKSRRGLVLSLTILSVFFSIEILQAIQPDDKPAITAAHAWLSLVDSSKYSESWDEAAELFRAAVAKDQWQKSLKAIRSPLGKVVERKLKSKQYTRSLPGAPDGEYVVIQYETTFEKKRSAIETITPMLDKDGKWRVSGYYIQ
jgi:hypothetical protein